MKIIALVTILAVSSVFCLDKDGLPGVNRTQSAKSAGHGKLGIGFMSAISTDGRSIENMDGGNNSPNFLPSLSFYPFLSLGITDFVDISTVLPVYWDDYSHKSQSRMNDPQLGDFRWKIKLQVPYFAKKHIVDGALIVGGNLPTAQKGFGVIPKEIEYLTPKDYNDASPIFGTGEIGMNYGLALTVDFGEIEEKFQFQWHLNVGWRKQFNTDFEDVFLYSIAFDYQILPFLSAFLEFAHESRTDTEIWGEEDEYKTEPTLLSAGAELNTPVGINIMLGFEIGLNNQHVHNVYIPENGSSQSVNYDVLVNPPFKTLIGVNWDGYLIPQDDDKDGVDNKRDACPKTPEDKDGYKDHDGCPDNDNDEDGIPDVQDSCADIAEDVDGFQDEDGCPDTDNDQDGIVDLKDACPIIAEDMDGFEDADGCPDTDNDKDGVPDTSDKCLMVAEDMDGFEDHDGCPDIDNDKDGIVDDKDKCPNKPEKVNGYLDEDGCPDEKKKPKKIEKKVTLSGINFKTGSSELTFESFSTLDGIVRQLLAYPKVHIEIRGHTDNVGSASSNQRLSERRAQAVVNYFIKKGITSNRMKATGYGESQPIAPNRTADGRRQNRRIEMYRTK